MPSAGSNRRPPSATTSRRSTRATLLRADPEAFDATAATLENPSAVAAAWEARAGLPGKRYRIRKDGGRIAFEATALALADGGGLLVEHDDGTRETIALADARALR